MLINIKVINNIVYFIRYFLLAKGNKQHQVQCCGSFLVAHKFFDTIEINPDLPFVMFSKHLMY